ncbi:Hypothetical protein LLKF_0607 [Lactococcus lactis subsp. lactis KF147]|nr:Hypothetical protein LLKF_0607 [Lactococcus lactis subsp. lactis KF147]
MPETITEFTAENVVYSVKQISALGSITEGLITAIINKSLFILAQISCL